MLNMTDDEVNRLQFTREHLECLRDLYFRETFNLEREIVGDYIPDN